MAVASQEAEELVLLATLTALVLARDRSIFEMALAGSFLTAVADQILLLAVVIEEEQLQAERQETAKKEKEAEERLAALEKKVDKLKDLCEKIESQK
jgi:hypothetical protein